MSRKLRFFKDQISKAGLAISGHSGMQPDLELEDLEVISFFDCYQSCKKLSIVDY